MGSLKDNIVEVLRIRDTLTIDSDPMHDNALEAVQDYATQNELLPGLVCGLRQHDLTLFLASTSKAIYDDFRQGNKVKTCVEDYLA